MHVLSGRGRAERLAGHLIQAAPTAPVRALTDGLLRGAPGRAGQLLPFLLRNPLPILVVVERIFLQRVSGLGTDLHPRPRRNVRLPYYIGDAFAVPQVDEPGRQVHFGGISLPVQHRFEDVESVPARPVFMVIEQIANLTAREHVIEFPLSGRRPVIHERQAFVIEVAPDPVLSSGSGDRSAVGCEEVVAELTAAREKGGQPQQQGIPREQHDLVQPEGRAQIPLKPLSTHPPDSLGRSGRGGVPIRIYGSIEQTRHFGRELIAGPNASDPIKRPQADVVPHSHHLDLRERGILGLGVGDESYVLNGDEPQRISGEQVLPFGLPRIYQEQVVLQYSLVVRPCGRRHLGEVEQVPLARHVRAFAHVHGEVVKRPGSGGVSEDQPDLLEQDHPPEVQLDPPLIQRVLFVGLPPGVLVSVYDISGIGIVRSSPNIALYDPPFPGRVLEVPGVQHGIDLPPEPHQAQAAVLPDLHRPFGIGPLLPLGFSIYGIRTRRSPGGQEEDDQHRSYQEFPHLPLSFNSTRPAIGRQRK